MKKNNEKLAIDQLSKLNNRKIQQCGLFIEEKHLVSGATLDGISW